MGKGALTQLMLHMALFAVLALGCVPAYGQQNGRGRLIKVGAFVYPLSFQYNGFSAHFEVETSSTRAKAVAFGPRLDFINVMNGEPVLLMGYGLKLYPFFKSTTRANSGFFVQIAPVVMPKIFDGYYERFGPGLSGVAGYQHMLNTCMTISFEASLSSVRDLNKHAAQYNKGHVYQYVYADVKFGILLSSLKKRDQ